MARNPDDYRNLLHQQRFLEEIEQGIRFANREIIHKHIPEMTQDTILSLAVAVGRLRARYLEAALQMGGDDHGDLPGECEVEELSRRRVAFEEARSAFDALLDAISKGYIDVRELTRRE